MIFARRPHCGGVKGFEDFDLGVGDGVSKVFRINLMDISLAIVVVQALHVVLHTVLNVDGLLVKSRKGAGKVRFADYSRFMRVVNNDEIVRGDGAQTESVSGIALRNPVPAVLGVVQKARFLQVLAKAPEVERAKLFVLAQW